MASTAQVTVRIDWHEALAAVELISDAGKPREFCERDALRLEAVARTVREMLKEATR